MDVGKLEELRPAGGSGRTEPGPEQLEDNRNTGAANVQGVYGEPQLAAESAASF